MINTVSTRSNLLPSCTKNSGWRDWRCSTSARTAGRVHILDCSLLPWYRFSIIFIYMLLLPEGQKSESWEPSKKQRSFGNRLVVDRTAFARLLHRHPVLLLCRVIIIPPMLHTLQLHAVLALRTSGRKSGNLPKK